MRAQGIVTGLRVGRSRSATAGLSAVAVVAVAVLAVAFATALSAGTRTRPVVASSQYAPVVVEVPEFGTSDSEGPSPPPQFANATVVNNTAAGIHITGVTVTNGASAGLFSAVGPDTCSNTVLAARSYCVVGLRDSVPGDTSSLDGGSLIVHMVEQKDVTALLGNGSGGFYGLRVQPDQSPPPAVYSFGSFDVGTSSPARTVTVADIGTDSQQFGYLTQVGVTGEDPGDFSITADGCTGHTLASVAPTGGTAAFFVPQTCPVTVVARPGAAGNRAAWLDVTYCPYRRSSLGFATVCDRDGSYIRYALHLFVRLTVTGIPPTPPSTPTPPATGNPSSPVTGNPTPGSFSPHLTTSPEVVPAGRLTLVSGSGFPAGKPLTVAILPLGAAPSATPAALAALPQAVSTKTDGSGSFRDLPLVVMAHTPPGTYPLEAIAAGPSGPVAVTIGFLVVPGTEQPPQFVNRH